jgi:hypothetical protein
VPPRPGCPSQGPPSPEVTEAFCRVPSAPFSQAPRYALPVHLCRFRVRSITVGLFPGTASPPPQSDKGGQLTQSVTTTRPGTINPVPIDYGFRPRLRGRLTLGGLALPRNPWTFGVRGSRPHLATHVSIRTSDTSTRPHRQASQAYGTLRYRSRQVWTPQLRCVASAPVHLRRRPAHRPVSCYAFFKGWLLLSQPPGCFGLPTSFPT